LLAYFHWREREKGRREQVEEREIRDGRGDGDRAEAEHLREEDIPAEPH
jgi:hypothetical protein